VERFLTPSIFASTGNPNVLCIWDYIENYRNDTQKMGVLWDHWNTWVQEEDIRNLALLGFTHVRLPIGYWTMLTQEELDSRGEYYVTGQWPLVVRCLQWLKKYNIQAIIDLHGAPGSQNGWDNSGQLIVPNLVGWGQYDTVNRTLAIIETLSIWILNLENNVTTSGSVAGIELMNEAATWRIVGGLGTVQQYYLQAYPIVRNYLSANKYWVVIEEAFSDGSWNNFMQPPAYSGVVLDLHIYQCFDAGLRAASYGTHINVSCSTQAEEVLMQTLPTFVGEWSVAFKVESNLADTEPYPSQPDIDFMRQFALTQMKIYGSHFFWNFKTVSAPMWDWFLGVNGTWLPSSLPSQDTYLECGGTPGTTGWSTTGRVVASLGDGGSSQSIGETSSPAQLSSQVIDTSLPSQVIGSTSSQSESNQSSATGPIHLLNEGQRLHISMLLLVLSLVMVLHSNPKL